MTILRLTLIPFMSLWYVINIRKGEYQDILYNNDYKLVNGNFSVNICTILFEKSF